MEREDENYSEAAGEPEGAMVDYVVEEHGGVDRALSFADVMQFADFGPKLGLHPIEDAVNFLKFPVLNNQLMDGQFMYDAQELENNNDNGNGNGNGNGGYNNPVQLEFMGNSSMTGGGGEKIGNGKLEGKNTTKKKRPRCTKTNEEVESQRMTHIAVERNRRKQMNEHLRVLRSLMPTSYVQRGDQASIIGGAIEFVRELEQLLQCLESQKRRRLYGDQGGQTAALGFPSTEYEDDELRLVEMDPTSSAPGLLWEDNAESKSSIADVEVKMSGLNALIKILSRRRPGQLIKIIADLEQLQFTILHTNITTIEQTVLYSFNVQVSSEARFTAQDVASSVQQIFSFIHANTNII